MKIRFLNLSMAATLALSLFASPVMAQDSAPAENEVKPYEGSSYTLTPPQSWLLVSGSLSEKELSQLPPNIKEHFSQRNTDVLFMKTEQGKPKAGFINNLNIVIINEEIVLTDEVINELTPILKQQYESMFKPFTMETIEKRPFNDTEVLYVKGSYNVLNYPVTMEQYLIPSASAKESVVMTCTYNTETGKEDAEACINAIKSVELK